MDIPLETGIIGTMYTFFYGLFVNSIFKFLDEKYLQYRIYLGSVISKVQSLYNLALLTKNKNYAKAMRNELVPFMESFNTLAVTKYSLNQYYVNNMYKVAGTLVPNTPTKSTLYSRTLATIDDLSESREKLEIFGNKNLTKETRFIFLSTTVLYILVISFITFSQTNLYLNVVGILLISMVIFVTILMFNLDNLSYDSYHVKTKNIDDMLDMMHEQHGMKK